MTDRRASWPQRRAVLEVLAAAVLFGTTGTTATLAPASASVVSLGAARLVIGGAILLLVLPGVGGSRRTALGLGRSRWGLAGALMVAAYQLAFFAGVSAAGVALGTLVTIGSGPLFVGLLSWPLLRERPSRPWWLTTLVCIVGLLLLAADGGERSSVDPGGLLLALGAGFAYALYTVSAKRLISDGAASEDAMACLFGIGGLLMLPVLLASGLSWLGEPSGLAAALWLGAATIAAAYVLFGRGLRRLPAGAAATLVLAEPLVATALGVVLLGERLGWLGWAGATLVALGLLAQGLLATRSRA
jgi:DME family drug/metabolite transporter